MITMELTEKEAQALSMTREGYFKVTYVHRDDLASIGFNLNNVTDDQMEELAEKMGSAYTEIVFWIDLKIIANDLSIPRKARKELE